MKQPLHKTDLRLRNNAGMDFPACRAQDELLDLDCGHWPMTNDWKEVTCPDCLERRETGNG